MLQQEFLHLQLLLRLLQDFLLQANLQVIHLQLQDQNLLLLDLPHTVQHLTAHILVEHQYH